MAVEWVKSGGEAFLKPVDVTGPGVAMRRNGRLRHVRELIEMDLVRMPTATGDWSLVVPYDEDFEEYLFADIFHYYDDELLLAGELASIDHDHNDSTTTLTGPDVTDRLSDGYAIVEYDNALGHQTVENYVTDHMGDIDVDWVVHEPTPEQSVESERLYNFTDVDAWSDVHTPRDDIPVEITADGQLMAQRQTWNFWDQNANWSGITTNPAASGDWGGDGNVATIGTHSTAGDTLTAYFTTDHVIPANELKFRYRSATKGLENVGNYEYPAYEWRFDGQVIRTMASPFSSHERQFRWLQGPTVGWEVQPGSHKLELVMLDDGDAAIHDNYGLDLVYAYDDRWNYHWDNDNGNQYTWNPYLPLYEPGYLDGPASYPGNFWVELDTEISADFTIWSVTLNGYPGSLCYQLSFDGGQTWTDTQCGTYVNVDATESATSFKLRLQIGKGRSTRTDATPKTGYKRPWVFDLWIGASGEERIITDSLELKGDHLDNMQKLHDRAGLDFVLEYEGPEGVTGHTFRRGDPKVENDHDWDVIDEQRSVDAEEYANVVTVIGAIDDIGDRLTHTAESQAEIEEIGQEVHETVVDSDLDTQTAVDNAAVNELRRRVRERYTTGSLTVVPESIPPGYSYYVDEWGDYFPVERIRYSLKGHDLEGSVDFNTQRDVVGEISYLRARLRDMQ